jgi:hypothetical protein
MNIKIWKSGKRVAFVVRPPAKKAGIAVRFAGTCWTRGTGRDGL